MNRRATSLLSPSRGAHGGAARRLRGGAVAGRPVRADEPRDVRGPYRGRRCGAAARDPGVYRRRAGTHPDVDFERVQQHRRPDFGGQRPAAGRLRPARTRPGTRHPEHRIRLRRPVRSGVGGGHSAWQPGLRADVREMGIRSGALPVRAALRPDDGARRRRLADAARRRAGRIHSRRAGAQQPVRRGRRRPPRPVR